MTGRGSLLVRRRRHRTGSADGHGGGDGRDGRNGHDRRDGRNGRDGAQVMERPSFSSYYGLPVIRAPRWERRDIASYLFLGGLAGGSSTLALAEWLRRGDGALVRNGELAAVGAIGLSTAALVHDLGRPARFANMLRVCKPTSPMSVGSWLLAVYGPLSGVAAGARLTGRAHRLGAIGRTGAGVLGPAVAAYTAVLLADTAVPAWHDARRELPAVFTASAAMAAGGTALVTTGGAACRPAQRFALAGAAGELLALEVLRKRAGLAAEAYRRGDARRFLRTGRALALSGVVAAVAARRHRGLRVAAGALLTAASACTRFGVFSAGVISAEDPRFVVEPQRSRLEAETAANR
ncbi:MAG: NrfD/PsrC family molybdoenzyme membrane anchor subunit [Acidimicrobiia bacterium]